MAGPLSGIKVVELGGIGPAPFAAMVLADLGAEVIRIDRTDGKVAREQPVLQNRSRRSIAIDLKAPVGVELLLQLVDRADALIEGFRPGVMERLGLGPDVALARNARLVYSRMTGWGQDGPLATRAGHDINYISISGLLYYLRRPPAGPTAPLALLGDFGGGGMLLVCGVLSGLLEAKASGLGQVVDVASVDGAALLATNWHNGGFDQPPGTLLTNGASHFYDVYETADGQHVSVGAVEPQFYAQLVDLLGLDPVEVPQTFDAAEWPPLKERFAALFRTKTRDGWTAILQGSDTCFAPVLTAREAAAHPHNQHRGTFVEVDGWLQPAPAPRFSRTPSAVPTPPPAPGQHSVEVLRDWGISDAHAEEALRAGVVTTAEHVGPGSVRPASRR